MPWNIYATTPDTDRWYHSSIASHMHRCHWEIWKRPCYPGGHYWDNYLGALSSIQQYFVYGSPIFKWFAETSRGTMIVTPLWLPGDMPHYVWIDKKRPTTFTLNWRTMVSRSCNDDILISQTRNVTKNFHHQSPSESTANISPLWYFDQSHFGCTYVEK